MEFQPGALIDREIEIAGYLLRGFSICRIARHTGLRKRIVAAHIRNMRQKLNAADAVILIKLREEEADVKETSDKEDDHIKPSTYKQTP